MKVTGFTFVRNGIKFDYPVAEAIRSLLPICDEVVVAVGKSEDSTLDMIRGIDPAKVRIIETVWDDSKREGGRVLAEETDKALRAVSADTDWAIYVQADEVVHEDYYDNIRQAMEKWKDDKNVDGLLFKFYHFYGSYGYIADAYNWCRREVRVVRNDESIYSYGDALGFRKGDNEKLRVKPVEAWIYHYGWVKPPAVQQQKQESFHKLWHNDEWVQKNIVKATEYDYSQIDSVAKFEGRHPAVMHDRIARLNWDFEFDRSRNRLKWRYRLRRWLEKALGINIGEYRNYNVV